MTHPGISREVIRHPDELTVAILAAAERGVEVSVADAYLLDDGRLSFRMGLTPQHSYLPPAPEHPLQLRRRDICVVAMTIVVGALSTAVVFLSLVVLAWISAHELETALIVVGLGFVGAWLLTISGALRASRHSGGEF